MAEPDTTQKKHNKAKEKNMKNNKALLPGIVWWKNKWRMFYDYEDVTIGKYKGFVKIQLLKSSFYVRKMHIKRFPESPKTEAELIADNDRLTTGIKPGWPDKPWIVSVSTPESRTHDDP